MRKIVITLILIISFLSAHAQRKKIDSLKGLVAASKQDTSRAILLSQLGYAYLNSRPDSTVLLGQQALQLSRYLRFLKGEQRALTALGNAFNSVGDYPKALTAYLDALKAAESMHDAGREIKTLLNIGNVYSQDGGSEAKY